MTENYRATYLKITMIKFKKNKFIKTSQVKHVCSFLGILRNDIMAWHISPKLDTILGKSQCLCFVEFRGIASVAHPASKCTSKCHIEIGTVSLRAADQVRASEICPMASFHANPCIVATLLILTGKVNFSNLNSSDMIPI